MSATYRITLAELSADATAVEASGRAPLELGELTPAALEQLLANLARLEPAALLDAEPAIIIRRHSRAWRVTPGNKTLLLHDGLEPLASTHPLDPAGILAALDPAPHSAAPNTQDSATGPETFLDRLRSLSPAQAIPLLLAGLALLATGLWFGLHTEDINAIPGDVVILTAPAEADPLLAAAAGQYLTPVSPGNGVLTLTRTGHFSIATLGPDGHPLPATYEEEARAGRRAGQPCIVTTVGLIAIVDRDTLSYNDILWHRHAAHP